MKYSLGEWNEDEQEAKTEADYMYQKGFEAGHTLGLWKMVIVVGLLCVMIIYLL